MRTVLLHGLTALMLALSGAALSGCDATEDAEVEEEEQVEEGEDD